jgi:hypothetical protein
MGITAFKKYSVELANRNTGVNEVVEMEALNETHLTEEINDCFPDCSIVGYKQIEGFDYE